MKREIGQRPRVGVGIMIFKGGKVLLGKRKGSHGAGEFAFPGGHLEHLESFGSCARRELAEECGVKVKNIRFQFIANVGKYRPAHYVHVGLTADWKSGTPKVLEPEKCESWGWYDLERLPKPLFHFCRLSVQAYENGETFFDLN